MRLKHHKGGLFDMTRYFRVRLGKNNRYADECFKGSYIAVGYIHENLSGELPDNWREFNKKFIPIRLKEHPAKTKIGAGLACGAIWTICKGIRNGDIVICPNNQGSYYVGKVQKDYSYHPGGNLPHHREVEWYPKTIERSAMSDALRKSIDPQGPAIEITKYAEEIERLVGDSKPPTIISTDDTIEDPSEFALEKHLEDFLVQNWKQTELGNHYDIYEEDGELVGQQYPSDTGPIDILAISKDKKTLLVVELKKGRVSDNVVGQIQRYMGFVLEELAEENQQVKGAIIALEDDLPIKRALSVANNIDFYRYQVSFKLFKS